jgi:hypothetical protein
MRKQNHSIPPVLKHNDRLNNSVVPRRRRKRPNAQKHGVFAEPLILPGEDPREFEALHSALIEEWTPSGPSEQSRVFGMADAEWRKLRSRSKPCALAPSDFSDKPEHEAPPAAEVGLDPIAGRILRSEDSFASRRMGARVNEAIAPSDIIVERLIPAAQGRLKRQTSCIAASRRALRFLASFRVRKTTSSSAGGPLTRMRAQGRSAN